MTTRGLKLATKVGGAVDGGSGKREGSVAGRKSTAGAHRVFKSDFARGKVRGKHRRDEARDLFERDAAATGVRKERLVDRRVERGAVRFGELRAGRPEASAPKRGVVVNLAANGARARVGIGEGTDNVQARVDVFRRVFADVRIARDRGREVVREAFVHRARRIDRALCVAHPLLELDGGVDNGVGKLMVNDVAVVRVVVRGALAEPHGAAGEVVDGPERIALAARREERVLKGCERHVRIAKRTEVACREARGDVQVRDGGERLVVDHLRVRLTAERPEERVRLRCVEIHRHFGELVAVARRV